MKEAIKRLKRVAGDFSMDCLWELDNEHILVKPKSFSNTGILLDGETVSSISYGDIGVLPVAMTYGLDTDQTSKVLDQCLHQVQRLVPIMKSDSKMVAREIAGELTEEVCACLQPLRQSEDETLKDIVKRLSLTSRTKYLKIMAILKRVPRLGVQKRLGLSVHPLYRTRGALSSQFLRENQLKLIADARQSFIPFLTDSSLEQDHYGLRKMLEKDLTIGADEFSLRRSRVPFSKMHIHGINSLPMRAGFEPRVPPEKSVSPIKKKRIFEKAQNIFGYLEENDDPVMLEAFGKLVSYLAFSEDPVDYGRLVIADSHDNPFVIPIIVQDPKRRRYPIDFKPMEALDLMDSKMEPPDFMGSANLSPHHPFPYGADTPLDPPSRLRPEYK